MTENKKTIFGPGDFALPPYDPDDERFEKWSVIACDQFTSEPEYWDEVKKETGEFPSTFHFMLPEAYLNTPVEQTQREDVRKSMEGADDFLSVIPDCLIDVKRTLPDGSLREGIVGVADLEAYDFSPESASKIRATEATVFSRIPARRLIREESDYEMSHVMMFYSDPEDRLLSQIRKEAEKSRCLYRTKLILGGGAEEGYAIEGEALERTISVIRRYEEEMGKKQGFCYAVGDGNHSLAAAKATYEDAKKQMGEKALSLPIRYAMVELVRLEEDSIQFEPVYRLITGQEKDCEELLREFDQICEEDQPSGQKVRLFTGEKETEKVFRNPTHALPVGTLQNFLDVFLKSHPGTECDYVHGEESLKEAVRVRNSRKKGCAVGFLTDSLKKEELFPYVAENGILPRKTFSMGEARSKRYYMELRKIR